MQCFQHNDNQHCCWSKTSKLLVLVGINVNTVEKEAQAVVASHDKATTQTSHVQMVRIVKGKTILISDESIREEIPIGTNENGGSRAELTTDQRDSFLKGEVDLILTN